MRRRWEDDCGRQLEAPARPQRVICLCPSLTETLCALGIGERLVGRTRYCIHPAEELETVTTVGGTKQIDHAAIAALQPDLIIAEKEENRAEDVAALEQHWPVYVCEIQTQARALECIGRLGELINETSAGLQQQLRDAWDSVRAPMVRLPTLYLIWRKPWMVAGQPTYIDAVMQRCGLQNLAAPLEGRYPQVSLEHLQALNPRLVLLSSEPYPFGVKHQQELADALPGARVELVDGEMFSWYGARMVPAATYLVHRMAAWEALAKAQ